MKKSVLITFYLILMIGLILISGCTQQIDDLQVPEYTPRTVTYQTETVQLDSIEIIKSLFGSVVPLERKEIFYDQVSGYLVEHYVSGGDVVEKGDPLALIESIDLERQFRDQKLELEKARLRYERANAEYEITGRDQIDRDLTQLDYTVAQYRYDLLQDQMDNLTLRSPMDGSIEFTQARQGQFIDGSTAVVRIMDDSKRYVRFRGDSDLDFLGLGDVIEFGAHPNQYKGEIVRIDPIENFFWIEPEGEFDRNLNSGVSIDIVLDSKQDIIVIPKNAIQEAGGRKFVYILDANGVRVEREIRTGWETSNRTEVLFGLEVGDELIISSN